MSFFVVIVRRRNSIHGFDAPFPTSFWIVPTSRMCTSARTASTSNPIAAIWASRLGRVCSRETYRHFASRWRAFAWRIA